MTRPTLLIAEDDPDIRQALALFLEAEGYEVMAACNGLEALELLRGDRKPRVILLDWDMPVLDADGFCRERAKDAALAGIPVLLLTAGAGSEALAARLGAAGSVPKPIAFDDLLERVGRLCRP